MKKRRAVGEIMAALILMFIASMAGVILFTTSIRISNAQGSILRTQIQTESESVQESFNVLYVAKEVIEDETVLLNIWVYNYGKEDIEIMNIYIQDLDSIYFKQFSVYELIESGEIPNKIQISLEVSGAIKITVVSKRGVKDVSDWTI